MPSEQNVSQETPENPDSRFLCAWKDAVAVAGEHVFSLGCRKPDEARHWRQLTPDLNLIRASVKKRSKADAIFVSALACFYNSEEGQKLLDKSGGSFGDMSLILDTRQRSILATLFVNYQGW